MFVWLLEKVQVGGGYIEVVAVREGSLKVKVKLCVSQVLLLIERCLGTKVVHKIVSVKCTC